MRTKKRLGARVVQNAFDGSARTDRAGAVPLGGTAAGPWHPGTTIHAAVNAATHPVNARLRTTHERRTTHDVNGRARCPVVRPPSARLLRRARTGIIARRIDSHGGGRCVVVSRLSPLRFSWARSRLRHTRARGRECP